MPETIYLISALTYVLRTIIFSFGALRERKRSFPSNGDLPYVSVIVPARNEEKNITACIRSIAASNYPAERFEIVAVDDRSTDQTARILTELSRDIPSLKILTITDDSQKGNLKGKSGALNAGVQVSQGEILAMTDADCVVERDWLRAIVEAYDTPEVGIVASYTLINIRSVFDRIQAVEWMYNHTLASAGIGLRQPLGCFGNNLSVRRGAFERIGGYENIAFSVTEDLALLQAVVRDGWQARYICDERAVVNTYGCATFPEYLRQRHRWAHGGKALGWRATIFVLSSLSLWLGIGTALLNINPAALFFVLGVRFLGDFAILAPTLSRLKRPRLRAWILPSVVFITMLEFVVPFMLLKKSVTWKGQQFPQ